MGFGEAGTGYFGVDWAWFTGDQVYDFWLALGFAYSLSVAIGCLFVKTPYGKFADNRFGFELDPRLGWWLMELPATVSFVYFYRMGENAMEPARLFFATLFLIHYSNRGWFFPLTLRVSKGQKSSFSILVVLFGVFFTTLHGYLNAMWFSTFAQNISTAWFSNPIFIVGFLLYEMSFLLTLHSEYIVRNLRDPNDTKGPRYKIPQGGGFELVTNPAYLGELAGWLGWFIMTLNPGGAVVFLVSSANLLPRAFAQHKWYQEKFDDYPTNRKVIIPYLI